MVSVMISNDSMTETKRAYRKPNKNNVYCNEQDLRRQHFCGSEEHVISDPTGARGHNSKSHAGKAGVHMCMCDAHVRACVRACLWRVRGCMCGRG
jgi:hypothetical protein